LARENVKVCSVGRNPDRLAETVAAARPFAPMKSFELDLVDDRNLQSLVVYLERHGGKLDILVHSAGIIHQNTIESGPIEDLDVQYATNVRAPYLLTQRLLQLLTAARGQVAFINSSVGLAATRANVGQYAATKHALKAIADSLREEVNPRGIRVLTVYLGRTATPMQEEVSRQEGKAYRPEALLQPEDVALVVVHALTLPSSAEVTDISIRPMQKSY
jgi:NADP-dependent 3-hydroxy acid dehydrogenase YdfG